jgi:hypothetical protein
MNTFKSIGAAVALAITTLASGAASAYPIVVAAPGPVVVAPRPVVVAPPVYAGVYLHPAWVGGVYYRYPYWYHGVRYFGPRPGWGYHYHWVRRWR